MATIPICTVWYMLNFSVNIDFGNRSRDTKHYTSRQSTEIISNNNNSASVPYPLTFLVDYLSMLQHAKIYFFIVFILVFIVRRIWPKILLYYLQSTRLNKIALYTIFDSA